MALPCWLLFAVRPTSNWSALCIVSLFAKALCRLEAGGVPASALRRYVRRRISIPLAGWMKCVSIPRLFVVSEASQSPLVRAGSLDKLIGRSLWFASLA